MSQIASISKCLRISPAAKVLIERFKLDKFKIASTGPKNLILKQDVLRCIKNTNFSSVNTDKHPPITHNVSFPYQLFYCQKLTFPYYRMSEVENEQISFPIDSLNYFNYVISFHSMLIKIFAQSLIEVNPVLFRNLIFDVVRMPTYEKKIFSIESPFNLSVENIITMLKDNTNLQKNPNNFHHIKPFDKPTFVQVIFFDDHSNGWFPINQDDSFCISVSKPRTIFSDELKPELELSINVSMNQNELPSNLIEQFCKKFTDKFMELASFASVFSSN